MAARRAWAVGLLVAAALGLYPAPAGAHPQLAGDWVSPTPPGGFLIYTFAVGEHLGNGVWRGKFMLNAGGASVLAGCYELRMYDENRGTLGPLSTATSINPNVGNVDFGRQVFEIQNVTYRHRPATPAIVLPTPPLP